MSVDFWLKVIRFGANKASFFKTSFLFSIELFHLIIFNRSLILLIRTLYVVWVCFNNFSVFWWTFFRWAWWPPYPLQDNCLIAW
jgi:hypothetical protein